MKHTLKTLIATVVLLSSPLIHSAEMLVSIGGYGVRIISALIGEHVDSAPALERRGIEGI